MSESLELQKIDVTVVLNGKPVTVQFGAKGMSKAEKKAAAPLVELTSSLFESAESEDSDEEEEDDAEESEDAEEEEDDEEEESEEDDAEDKEDEDEEDDEEEEDEDEEEEESEGEEDGENELELGSKAIKKLVAAKLISNVISVLRDSGVADGGMVETVIGLSKQKEISIPALKGLDEKKIKALVSESIKSKKSSKEEKTKKVAGKGK